MNICIIAKDAVQNPKRRTIVDVSDASARVTFSELKAARKPVEGLAVVELWTEERGRIDRYFAEQKEQSKKGTK